MKANSKICQWKVLQCLVFQSVGNTSLGNRGRGQAKGYTKGGKACAPHLHKGGITRAIGRFLIACTRLLLYRTTVLPFYRVLPCFTVVLPIPCFTAVVPRYYLGSIPEKAGNEAPPTAPRSARGARTDETTGPRDAPLHRTPAEPNVPLQDGLHEERRPDS